MKARLKLPDQTEFEFNKDNSAFSVLCENLLKLRLHNFPFGDGDWRAPDAFECENPYLETVTDLDKTSKLSIYHNEENWSPDIPKLRKISIENPHKIDLKYILNSFSKVRFTSPTINRMDSNLNRLRNLRSLSFAVTTGLERIEFDNLPSHLEELHFVGCDLDGLAWSIESSNKYPYLSIIHLGLAMNKLKSIVTDPYLTHIYFPNLKSIDLCSNNLADLESFIKNTRSLKFIEAVNLSNNPLCLYKYYVSALITDLNLTYLDDKEVLDEQRSECKEKMSDYRNNIADSSSDVKAPLNNGEFIIEIQSLSGLDKKGNTGDIWVELVTPYWDTYTTEKFSWNSQIIFQKKIEIPINEDTIDHLYECTSNLAQENQFLIKIMYEAVVQKKGKNKGGTPKDTPKKGKKGKEQTPNSTPHSTSPTAPPITEIGSGTFFINNSDTLQPVFCGGGEFMAQSYTPPCLTPTIKDEKEKKVGKKKKKHDSGGPVIEPIVVNVKSCAVYL